MRSVINEKIIEYINNNIIVSLDLEGVVNNFRDWVSKSDRESSEG